MSNCGYKSRSDEAHRLTHDVAGAVGHQERDQIRDVLGNPGALEDATGLAL
jgi:hypothetical protein